MGLYSYYSKQMAPNAANRTSQLGNFGSLAINQNCRVDYVAEGIQSGVGLFYLLGQKAANKSPESPKDTEKDDETKAKNDKDIEDKNKELEDVYKEAGCTTYSEVQQKISAQGNVVTNLEGELTKYQNAVKAVDDKIKALDKQNSNYQADLQKLQTEKTEAENKVTAKEKELNDAKIEKVRLEAILGKADNIKLEIKKLQEEDTGVSYDVEQETKDIKDFMTALDNFKKNPSKETAEKLKASYEEKEGDKNTGIQTKSIQKAYELVQKDVEKYLTQQQQPAA